MMIFDSKVKLRIVAVVVNYEQATIIQSASFLLSDLFVGDTDGSSGGLCGHFVSTRLDFFVPGPIVVLFNSKFVGRVPI